jgi:hypothetical protein
MLTCRASIIISTGQEDTWTAALDQDRVATARIPGYRGLLLRENADGPGAYLLDTMWDGRYALGEGLALLASMNPPAPNAWTMGPILVLDSDGESTTPT